ncbi:hypothetical protein LTR94_023821 [Friedmanniomyces endolithicus]|nr:hypothetical protein LTR94_023821 [Friedmanniomyces endolithicus]
MNCESDQPPIIKRRIEARKAEAFSKTDRILALITPALAGVAGEVDWDDAPLNTRLWCVYGADCFPTVFACQIKDHPQVGRVVWGFSIHRRAAGYRTLGTGREWALKNNARFFLTPDAASLHLFKLFQALDTLKAGAPGLSGRTAETLAQIISRKAALSAAEPAPVALDEGATLTGWDREICTGCSSSLSISDIKKGGFVSCCPERRMVKVSELVEAFEASRRAHPSPPPAAQDDRLWAWDALAKRPGWEISFSGDDEEDGWSVHSVAGGVNDREWTELARADTPLEAVLSALKSEAAK